MPNGLRPIERRILTLHQEGVDHAEIASRFRKSPEFIDRVLAWTEIPRNVPRPASEGHTPIERRVMALLAEGLSYAEIATRFRRNARYIKRIENHAKLRSEAGLA
jgi:DNA-binding CsgD family transcriptional regulator